MKKKARVLFVSQEITPYLKESPLGLIGRHLPQGIQERGKEIRTFMPRFGCINERRNQLHEVIRLSGMNLIIDDTDHPLIIKVASIQQARMQIYFIDNEDYFQRKFTLRAKDGSFYEDNDERAVFFSRGVLETVKKLGWGPDLVHCHGWMTSLIPLYLKKAFHDDPLFSEAKVIVSVYDDEFTEKLHENFTQKIMLPGINDEDIENLKQCDFVGAYKGALQFADGIIQGSETINPELDKYIQDSGKPFLPYQGEENYIDVYNDFYDRLLEDSEED